MHQLCSPLALLHSYVLLDELGVVRGRGEQSVVPRFSARRDFSQPSVRCAMLLWLPVVSQLSLSWQHFHLPFEIGSQCGGAHLGVCRAVPTASLPHLVQGSSWVSEAFGGSLGPWQGALRSLPCFSDSLAMPTAGLSWEGCFRVFEILPTGLLSKQMLSMDGSLLKLC